MQRNIIKIAWVWTSVLCLMRKIFPRKTVSWDRDVLEELTEENDSIDMAVEMSAKSMFASLCMSEKKGVDYQSAKICLGTFMEFVLKSHQWIPEKECTQAKLMLQDEKAMMVVADMFSRAFRLTRGIDKGRADMFTSALIKDDYNIIMHVFARWMHNRAVENNMKIMDQDFTTDQLQDEVARISDMIVGPDLDAINPRLTSEALFSIAESTQAIQNIEDLSQVKFDQSSKQTGQKLQQMMQKRMGRAKNDIEMLAFRIGEMIQDAGVANPEHISRFVQDRMKESMDQAIARAQSQMEGD